jgi:hypothetical protein
MKPIHRALAGCAVNLSISESDDSSKLGFPDWQVNRVTVQVVAALFGQGATLVFGHDWRDDGVMEAVCGFAQQVQSPVPIPAEEAESSGDPMLRNILPWPDTPFLAKDRLESLGSVLKIEQAGLPVQLAQVAEQAKATPKSNLYMYVRARGLTFLRYRLNDICNARLCIGGRLSKFQGRYPGVIEEAILAFRSDKPLYLIGLLGGAVKQLGEALEGKPVPADFCSTAMVKAVYQNPPVEEDDPTTLVDRTIDPEAIWNELKDGGLAKLSQINKLTPQENQLLLHTQAFDQAMELVLKGLSALHSS